jgi:hypothetical protein
MRLTDQLATSQIVSVQISASQPENHWIEFARIFKDDPDFAKIAQELRANRTVAENET